MKFEIPTDLFIGSIYSIFHFHIQFTFLSLLSTAVFSSTGEDLAFHLFFVALFPEKDFRNLYHQNHKVFPPASGHLMTVSITEYETQRII